MDMIEYVKRFLPEELYSILTTIYLISLNKLNRRLLSMNLEDNPVNLLQYENWKPLKYFGFAFLLFVIGGCIIWHRAHYIRWDAHVLGEIITSIVAILVISIFLLLLFIFINNPILRAILVVVVVILGVGYASTS